LFGTFLRPVLSRFTGLLPRQDAAPIVAPIAVPSTQVVNLSQSELRQQTATVESPRRISATDSKTRFRRTTEEIALGLTAVEAAARRGNSATVPSKVETTRNNSVKPTAVQKKAVRFRRTSEELGLGLSIEQAAARRGVKVPERKIAVVHQVETPKQYAPKPAQQPTPQGTTDLITALSPRIQARARAVTRYRRGGHQGQITQDMLSAVDKFIAEKGVTKCPTGVDSDGYDHFKREAR
jgi:hypothetical protein